jgi:hypothetical protein
LRKFIATTIREYLNESIDELSKHEKIHFLKQNKPIIVYRGIHESGKNFYKGDKKLPFTYYSLTKEKAELYGNISKFIFNEKSLPINELFDKFGLNGNVENKEVLETLIDEGYSAVLIKGDELVVFDETLIKEI